MLTVSDSNPTLLIDQDQALFRINQSRKQQEYRYWLDLLVSVRTYLTNFYRKTSTTNELVLSMIYTSTNLSSLSDRKRKGAWFIISIYLFSFSLFYSMSSYVDMKTKQIVEKNKRKTNSSSSRLSSGRFNTKCCCSTVDIMHSKWR